MAKYELDKELRKIAWIKAPSSIHAYPPANVVLRLVPCRSDARARVRRCVTPVHENGRLTLRSSNRCEAVRTTLFHALASFAEADSCRGPRPRIVQCLILPQYTCEGPRAVPSHRQPLFVHAIHANMRLGQRGDLNGCIDSCQLNYVFQALCIG